MKMNRDYEKMPAEELKKALEGLKEQLEDIEDTFQFNLTHTSAHLSSGAVAEHEAEIEEYREKIARIEVILKTGGAR